jgi:hypothetical protein
MGRRLKAKFLFASLGRPNRDAGASSFLKVATKSERWKPTFFLRLATGLVYYISIRRRLTRWQGVVELS